MVENNLSNPLLGVSSAEVLTVGCSRSPGWHLNTHCLAPSPELNSTDLRSGPRICFPHRLPGDTDTAALGLYIRHHSRGTTPGEPLEQRPDRLESLLNSLMA